jgi:hypothetical protein
MVFSSPQPHDDVDQLNARRMRLVAERDDTHELVIPPEFDGRVGNLEIAENINAERALFSARKQTIDGQKRQLRRRIGQIGQEAEGLVVHRDANKEELSWIFEELSRVKSLSDQGLIQFGQMAELLCDHEFAICSLSWPKSRRRADWAMSTRMRAPSHHGSGRLAHVQQSCRA